MSTVTSLGKSGAPQSDGRRRNASPEVGAQIVAGPEVEPAFGPILIRSIGVATVLMFVGTGLPMWAISGGVWDGVGLGAFCAFWGGPGFGLMAAGASWTHKLERHHRDLGV